MKNKSIFREEALDKLSKPENLDHALRITKPSYWHAVIGAAVVLIALCAWGFFGYINTTINTELSFIYTTGYTNTYWGQVDGLVTGVDKTSGTFVHRGDVVYEYRESFSDEIKTVNSPVTGLIIKNEVFPGAEIYPGMETLTIRAFTVNVDGNEYLYDEKPGALASSEYKDFEKKVYICVPTNQILNVHEGQDVIVKSSATSKDNLVQGKITKVGNYLVTDKEIYALFGLNITGEYARALVDTTLCECSLNDGSDLYEMGFREGDFVYASIITGRVHPINLIFDNLVNN